MYGTEPSDIMSAAADDECRIELVPRRNTNGLQPHPNECDYVLVGNTKWKKQQQTFIEALREKGFSVTEIEESDKCFYGIRAPDSMLDTYQYLMNDEIIFERTRIRVTDFVLNKTIDSKKERLTDLLRKNVFETAFPLHQKTQQDHLTEKWARWTALHKFQPIDLVKNYLGEKAALYFLWLGWYTYMLIPAAMVGIVVFLYGLAFFDKSPLIKEVCEANTTIMCPLCDTHCSFWKLSDTCMYAKVTNLFDNEGTVFFAIFMALWATIFLELWKRHRAREACHWKLYNWDKEEEDLVLEIVNNPQVMPEKYQHSYVSSVIVMFLVSVMIVIFIGLSLGLVVFRVFATVMLSESEWKLLKENANTVAVMLGAVVHYLTITIMTKVNREVAIFLCKIERNPFFEDKECSFTVKMFTFQFFTLFSSLFYVAFFLGRINGHPKEYVKIAQQWRLEECHPSGCMTDLFIQMAIIMILKQTLSNIVEFLSPWVKMKVNSIKYRSAKKKTDGEIDNWLRNYYLNNVSYFSLFNEFLEMVIQYSFTTIFVAAFPLAPFLALINNIFEIRLDAIKMTRLERRLVPLKTNNIGIWLQVLEGIGVLAVICNGLVIGITSDFIPRLVYKYRFGPCAYSNATDINCMVGYVENSLSTVNLEHLDPKHLQNNSNFVNLTYCRYRDYRSEEDFTLTAQFWEVFAARFAFVLLFEHVAVVIKFIAAWFVPDIPKQVKNIDLNHKFANLKKRLCMMPHRTTSL
ncbi:anoctamin-9 [Polypterus senegalus]|uniref:anoctamin-9 n=1 Tax=Polypterus senegalus TaxID=55291 RepID=UPI00196259E7|nr:anoctamin-9 [Polypterus senegalus]